MRGFALKSFDEQGSVMELPDPKVREDEVLLRIKAAGVNAFDPSVVQGAMKEAMEPQVPSRPRSRGLGGHRRGRFGGRRLLCEGR